MGVILTLGNASSPGEELEKEREEEKREEEPGVEPLEEPGVESLRGVAPPQELEANRAEFFLIPPQVPL